MRWARAVRGSRVVVEVGGVVSERWMYENGGWERVVWWMMWPRWVEEDGEGLRF